MPPEAKIYPSEDLDGELQRLANQLSQIETHLQAARSVDGENGSIQKAEEALHKAKIELDKHTRKHQQAQRPRTNRKPEQEQIKQMLREANIIKQSENLLQAILQDVPAGLAVFTGPDLIIQFANRTYQSFTPDHQLNPVGRRYEEVWPPRSGFQVKPLLLRVMQTRETIQSVRHKRNYSKGISRYFSIHLSPLTWEGKPAVLSVMWENTSLISAQDTAEGTAEKLRQERQLLDQIIQEAPVGIALLQEPEHRYLLVNAYYQEVSSAKGNLVGRTMAEVWPEVMEQLIAPLNHVYRTGTIHRAVDEPFRIQGPTGLQDGFFTYTFIPIKNQAGKVERIMIIVLETTDQVLTHRQVEAQRDQLVTLIDNMDDEVWFCDREGKIVLANLAAARNLGYTNIDDLLHPVEVVASELEIFNPDESPRSIEESPLLKALKGQAVRGEEILRNKQTGEQKYREYNATPINSKNGDLLGVVAVTRDISERKKLEQELQDNNRLLKSLIDNAPVGIVLTDDQATIRMMNPVAEKLFPRQAPYEKKDLHAYELITLHPDGSAYAPRDLPLARSALDGETYNALEVAVILPGGEKHHLLFNAAPIRNTSGKITGAVGAFQDITLRKQMETELEQAKSELEQRVFERTRDLEVANEQLLVEIEEREKTTFELQTSEENLQRALEEEQAMRSQLIQAEKNSALARMVASVAHELNNPIQTIQNCMFLLEEEVISNPAAVEYTKMAVSETQRVSRLVAQLRELYRPTKDNAPRPFNITWLLDDVSQLLGPHLQNHQVKWHVSRTGTDPIMVTGVIDQIKQVFLNVSLNAIDAMQPGGGLLEVIISRPKTDMVCITFKDTGTGIRPEDLHHLFEPFFTTKEKGSGLGLSICHEIIRNHNGEITVESQPGEGASFSVWLPVS